MLIKVIKKQTIFLLKQKEASLTFILLLPVVLVHELTHLLTQARKLRTIPGLKPDGKAQVSVEYQFGVPKRVSAVVVSCQHEDGV